MCRESVVDGYCHSVRMTSSNKRCNLSFEGEVTSDVTCQNPAIHPLCKEENLII